MTYWIVVATEIWIASLYIAIISIKLTYTFFPTLSFFPNQTFSFGHDFPISVEPPFAPDLVLLLTPFVKKKRGLHSKEHIVKWFNVCFIKLHNWYHAIQNRMDRLISPGGVCSVIAHTDLRTIRRLSHGTSASSPPLEQSHAIVFYVQQMAIAFKHNTKQKRHKSINYSDWKHCVTLSHIGKAEVQSVVIKKWSSVANSPQLCLCANTFLWHFPFKAHTKV